MAIFKIVDKSAVESSVCSGRRGVEIGGGKFGRRGRLGSVLCLVI